MSGWIRRTSWRSAQEMRFPKGRFPDTCTVEKDLPQFISTISAMEITIHFLLNHQSIIQRRMIPAPTRSLISSLEITACWRFRAAKPHRRSFPAVCRTGRFGKIL